MTDDPRARRLRRPLSGAAILAVLAVLGGILAGCGTTGPTASPTGASPSTGAARGSADPAASDGPLRQTETEWGLIWDALPAAFPRYPGSVADEPDEAASGLFVMAAPAATVATRMQAALEQAGYSTEAMSGPFEDGSIVIDSVGASADCRVETRIAPVGGTTRMTIMYGAGCPSA